ncbi:SDR family oxidoreductase [Fulvivirgaceae bacterium BMA10]|uniref:SDR family oxidoreductase n=1 Tax=Splendidivirga corallicola TaxID=3051826 RepID=A0ABT8KKQ6_9BACT|nr:SDR family oxidoreductase [Fulvivirgaceae bacterium BMA10]
MKILILGGTGRTGIWTVKEAIARGHEVVALARNPTKIPYRFDRLTIIKGTPEDQEAIAKAIQGCNAVISTLNISRKSDFPWAKLRTPQDFLARMISLLIPLCTTNGINRLIIVSAWGARESNQEIPGWFRWFINNSNIGYAYKQHGLQEEMLEKSELNWTSVRPVGLTNSKKRKEIRVSFHGKPKPKLTISRRNVARFMLDALEKELYIKEKPTISEI